MNKNTLFVLCENVFCESIPFFFIFVIVYVIMENQNREILVLLSEFLTVFDTYFSTPNFTPFLNVEDDDEDLELMVLINMQLRSGTPPRVTGFFENVIPR